MQFQIITKLKKTMRLAQYFGLATAIGVLCLAGPSRSQAQCLFSPAITVNDAAITYYELEQRAQFLRLLRAPGDPEKLARSALIEDRLKQQVVKQAGIEVAPEDVEAGIE